MGLTWRQAPDGRAQRVGEAKKPGPEKGLRLKLVSVNVTSLAPVVDLIDALPCDVVAIQECRVGTEYRILPSRAPSEAKPVPWTLHLGTAGEEGRALVGVAVRGYTSRVLVAHHRWVAVQVFGPSCALVVLSASMLLLATPTGGLLLKRPASLRPWGSPSS